MRRARKQENAENVAEELIFSRQTLGLSGVYNAREEGGYENSSGKRIRPGMLIRSGQLNKAAEEDIQLLSEQYKVDTVIDLRTHEEVWKRPDPLIPGAKEYVVPVLERIEDIGAVGFYTKMLFSETAKKAYRRLLLASDPQHAVLFHGADGRHRTGLTAALLLRLLEVPEKTVMEDYLLSNKAGGGAASNLFPHSLEHAFTTLKLEYGSVTAYLTGEYLLSTGSIKDLKNKYLF